MVDSIIEAGFIVAKTSKMSVYKLTGVIIADQNLNYKRFSLSDYIDTFNKIESSELKDKIMLFPLYKTFYGANKEFHFWSNLLDYHILKLKDFGKIGISPVNLLEELNKNKRLGISPSELSNDYFMVVTGKEGRGITHAIAVKVGLEIELAGGKTLSKGDTPFAVFCEFIGNSVFEYCPVYLNNSTKFIVEGTREIRKSDREGVPKCYYDYPSLAVAFGMDSNCYKISNLQCVDSSDVPSVLSGLSLGVINNGCFVGIDGQYCLDYNSCSNVTSLVFPKDCVFLTGVHEAIDKLNSLERIVINSNFKSCIDSAGFASARNLKESYVSSSIERNRLCDIICSLFPTHSKFIRKNIDNLGYLLGSEDVLETINKALVLSLDKKLTIKRY